MTNPRTFRNYRWIICALLFCATTVNYVDRQILSLLKPILDEQLHWTNTQFGAVNAAFQGAYAVGLLLFGWFVDRYGARIGYAASITAWSLAALGHALVSTVTGFSFARVALGLGEGGNFPAAVKVVGIWFPKRERALATSIFNSGSNVGAILAPAVVPWIALHWNWQAAFILAGLAGFLWLLAWFPLYVEPDSSRISSEEKAHIHSDQDAPREDRIPWIRLLAIPQTWSFIVAKFLTDPVWWFFLIWMPDYFKTTRHLDIKQSWIHLVTIYAIVTVLSIAGGWITGRLTRQGWSVTRSRKTVMFGFALCVLPILLATRSGDWTAVLLIGLAGAAHQGWSANLYTTVSDMFPSSAVASVIGIGSTAGALGGMLFPIVTGMLLDSFKATGNVSAGYALLFVYCALAYLAAFGLNHLLAKRYEPIHL